MSNRRLELQALLEEILGSKAVYFQPPNNIKMVYPCVVYHRDLHEDDFADNKPYRSTKRYLLTFISRDPDDPIGDKIKSLPMCRFSRHFTANNLNHDAFNLYF